MRERLLGAHCSIAGGLCEAPRRAAEIKSSTLQMFTKNSNQWEAPALLSAEITAFARAMDGCKVKLAFAHAGYLINLASPDETALSLSMRSMLAELSRAEALELPYLVVHAGSHKGAGELVGILQVVESLKHLVERTDGFRVRILLETTAGQGRSICYKFEHFSEIFSRLDKKYLTRLGVCLDTSHVFAAGYDIRTKKGYDSMWREFKKYIGREHLYALHLNDSAKECGTRVDRHEHIGKGLIGLEPFRLIMNDPKLAGLPMVIETPKGSTPAMDKKNLSILRKLIRD